MNRQKTSLLVVALAAILVLSVFVIGAQGAATAPASPLTQKQEAGKVLPAQSQALRHSNGKWNEAVESAGATFIRLHFVDFNLAAGSVLNVSSPDGKQKWSYTGKGTNQDGDFWSFAIDGDKVNVELVGEGSYRILDVGHGTIDLGTNPTPEIVVGTDGRENVACHLNDAVVNTTQKPVARLLFTVKRTQYVCTGELIRGANASTMITNAHCFSDQTGTSTVQALFNYQYTTCTGTTQAVTQSFAGGTFLKSNLERYSSRKATTTGLDYTLFTLKNDPELIYGELVATRAIYPTGTTLNFIQHPGGGIKKIGWFEDAEHTIRCKVDTINQTYGTSYPASQAGYGCDSEGGSSGSAITRASDGKIIALHHYGGVTPSLNSGTMMSFICQNAGTLLLCDAD